MVFLAKNCDSGEFHILSNGENRNLVACFVLEICAFKDTLVAACEKVAYIAFKTPLRWYYNGKRPKSQFCSYSHRFQPNYSILSKNNQNHHILPPLLFLGTYMGVSAAKSSNKFSLPKWTDNLLRRNSFFLFMLSAPNFLYQ